MFRAKLNGLTAALNALGYAHAEAELRLGSGAPDKWNTAIELQWAETPNTLREYKTIRIYREEESTDLAFIGALFRAVEQYIAEEIPNLADARRKRLVNLLEQAAALAEDDFDPELSALVGAMLRDTVAKLSSNIIEA